MDHEFEIEWNVECECYVWWHEGAGMTLEADTAEAAQEEASTYSTQGIFPGVNNNLTPISEDDWATLCDDGADDADRNALVALSDDEDGDSSFWHDHTLMDDRDIYLHLK